MVVDAVGESLLVGGTVSGAPVLTPSAKVGNCELGPMEVIFLVARKGSSKP